MTLWWLIGGAVLILAEIVVPGAVLAFLGIGAIIVGGLVFFGVIEHLIPAFTSWFIISLALILLLRGMAQRWSGGDEDWHSTDEDADAMDKIVEIVETIRPGETGRILHHGTTWPATCLDHTIEAGERARLLFRDNVAWVVEPLDNLSGDLDPDEGP